MIGRITSVKCKTPCKDYNETHMPNIKLSRDAGSHEEKVYLLSGATELEAIALCNERVSL